MTNWNKIFNNPLFGLGFYFFIKQLIKFLNFDMPENVPIIRSLYLASQSFVIFLSFYLMSVIKKKNDTTPLKYVVGDKIINTTVMEYDIEEVKKQLKQSFTSIAIISFVHLNFGYIQPLVMQGVMSFKTFLMSKESKIHFFNVSATGELRRPFRIESLLNTVSEKNQPKTDKASIKQAEKALLKKGEKSLKSQ